MIRWRGDENPKPEGVRVEGDVEARDRESVNRLNLVLGMVTW